MSNSIHHSTHQDWPQREKVEEPETDDLSQEKIDSVDNWKEVAGEVSKQGSEIKILIKKDSIAAFPIGLPPPDVLSEYEQVVPGLGKDIIQSWTTQQEHRKALELYITERAESRMDISQRNQFIISLVGIVGSVVAGIYGHWLASAFIVAVTVGGPSAVTAISRLLPPPHRRSENSGEGNGR